jgi:pimeloyl-ACP methyl ester carboxylesterase
MTNPSAGQSVSKVAIEGVDVFIEGEGEDTVVMMHGWPDTHRLWDAQVALLSGSHRCVRFTQPGFDPEKPARGPTLDELVRIYAAIVDHVSPGRPVTLLLHDWGCVFGLQYAMRHPERVARIAAIDIGDSNSAAFLQSLSAKAKLGIAGYQLWLALAWKIGGALGTRMTRSMARWLRCRSEPSLMSWQMNYPYWMTWTGGLKASRPIEPACPVLFIYGERKPFMFHSPRWIERVKALPGGEVLGLPTGHWVMVQAREAFNERLLGWLDRTSPAARTASLPEPGSLPRSPAPA